MTWNRESLSERPRVAFFCGRRRVERQWGWPNATCQGPRNVANFATYRAKYGAKYGKVSPAPP
jgi:hypothetical protein